MNKHIVKIISGVSASALVCGLCILNPSDNTGSHTTVKAEADIVSDTYDPDSFGSLLKRDKQNAKTDMSKYYYGYNNVTMAQLEHSAKTSIYLEDGDKKDLVDIYDKESGLRK